MGLGYYALWCGPSLCITWTAPGVGSRPYARYLPGFNYGPSYGPRPRLKPYWVYACLLGFEITWVWGEHGKRNKATEEAP